MADETTNNTKAMQELAAASSDAQKQQEKGNATYTQTSQVMTQLLEAMKQMATAMKMATSSGEELEISLEETEEESKKASKGFKTLREMFNKFAEKVQKSHPVLVGFALGALKGLEQGFKNVVAMSKGVLGFMESLADTAFNVTAAIIAIPFKLFNTLVDMAAKGGGGTELAQAYENVRKEFGSFKSNIASAVIDVSKNLKEFSQTGLSTWRVFGMLHERLELVMKLAAAMGPVFGKFTKEFREHGGAILAYQKGLGLTDEAMRGMGERALAMGEDVREGLNQITKYTLQFNGGVVNKQFSRDMAKAMADVKHFGGATIKEIGRSAEYAKQLGMELEKIVGVMDAFNTFDTAAENAAKLGQSFGMVVDSFKMVSAQSPDEMLNNLRTSFQATGKSTKDFTRQQWQLMAQTTGLNEDVVRLAMSEKNRGKSLKDIEKDAEKAKNKQLTQAQAMTKIADAIERLVRSGEQTGGFWDMFMRGIKRGIEFSEPFRKLMMNIKIALWAVFQEGMKLGTWLMSENGFPGLRDMVSSLADFFSPKRFRAMFAGVREFFQSAVTDLMSGKKSFPELMETLKSKFFDFFNDQEGPGKKLLESLRKMMNVVTKIFAESLKWLSTQLTEGLKWISSVLSGKVDLSKYVTQGADGGNIFLEMLLPIWDAVQEAWPGLYDALVECMHSAWQRLKKFMMSGEFVAVAIGVIATMMGVLFGPVVMQGILGAASGALTKLVFKIVTEGFEHALPRLIPWITKFFGSAAGQALGYATGIGLVIAVSLGVSDGMKKFRSKIKGDFTVAQREVAAGLTGYFETLTLGLVPDFLLEGMANLAVEAIKSFEDKINELGGGVGTNLIEMVSDWLSVLEGIGDIITGIFTLDSKRILSGFQRIIGGVVGTVVSVLMLTIKAPLLGVKWMAKGITSVISSMADETAAMFDKMGFSTLSWAAQSFGEVMKSVGSLVGGAIDVICESFDFLIVGIKWLVFKVTSAGDMMQKVFSKVFSSASDVIKDKIGSIILEYPWIGKVLDGLKVGFEQTGEMIAKIGRRIAVELRGFKANILDPIIGALKTAYETLKGIKNYMKNDMAGGQGNIAQTSGAKALAPGAKQAGKDAAQQNIDAQKKGAQKAATEEAAKPGLDLSDMWKNFMSGKGDVSGPMSVMSDAADSLHKLDQDTKMITAESLAKIRMKLNELFDPEDGIFMGLVGDCVRQKGNLEKISKDLEPVTNATKSIASALRSSLTCASDMVKASNDLDKALADGNINKIDVQGKLQRIAKSVGLNNAKYTIDNKMVQITVNLTVKMEAAELEDVIITQRKSVIRDRLNSIPDLKSGGTESKYAITSTGGPILKISGDER